MEITQPEIYKPPFFKTTEIFSGLVEKKLWLKFDITGQPRTDGKTIYLPDPSSCPQAAQRYRGQGGLYTILEHELSHIVFHSDARNLEKLYDKYPPYKQGIFVIGQIVEDHRVDSLMSQIYPGYGQKIRILRQHLLAEAKGKVGFNPLVPLLFAEQGLDYNKLPYTPVSREDYEKAVELIRRVELKSAKATPIITHRLFKLWKKYLPGGQEKEKAEGEGKEEGGEGGKEREGQKGQGQGQGQGQGEGQGEGEEGKEPSGQTKPGSGSGKTQATLEEFEGKKWKSASISEEGIKEMVETIAGGVKAEREGEDELETKPSRVSPKAFEDEKVAEAVLRDAHEEAEGLICEVKQKLHVTLEAGKPLDANIIGKIITKDVFSWSVKPAKPIPEALATLKGVFRRAKGKTKDVTDEEGIEVDLDDYIQKKAGNKEAGVFRDEEMIPGLHVAILLDVSGSMSGRPLEIAKSILLTLHAALKETKTVKYSVYAFSGSDKSAYITPVVRLTPERMADIEATSYFPYTHTHHGVQYVTNILSRETGKKLLIILTDGMPEARGHANPIVYTSIAISKARKKGIIVFSIFVSQSYVVDRESLRKVFGPETTWAVVEDMQHAGKVLINVVSRQVLNNLLKR